MYETVSNLHCYQARIWATHIPVAKSSGFIAHNKSSKTPAKHLHALFFGLTKFPASCLCGPKRTEILSPFQECSWDWHLWREKEGRSKGKSWVGMQMIRWLRQPYRELWWDSPLEFSGLGIGERGLDLYMPVPPNGHGLGRRRMVLEEEGRSVRLWYLLRGTDRWGFSASITSRSYRTAISVISGDQGGLSQPLHGSVLYNTIKLCK